MKKKKYIIVALLAILITSSLTAHVLAQSAYGSAIKKDSYEISRNKVEREIQKGDIFRDSFKITNLKDSPLEFSIFPTDSISDIIYIESTGAIIEPNNETEIYFTITGKELKEYSGEIVFSEGITERIPVNISIINDSLNSEFFVTIEPTKKRFTLKESLDFRVDVQKLVRQELQNVSFSYFIKNKENEEIYPIGIEEKNITGSSQVRKIIDLPENIQEGYYILEVLTEYQNRTTTSRTEFRVIIPFWSIRLFGFLPMWLMAIILSLALLSILSFFFIKRAIEKSKKYKMQLFTKTLPTKNERSLWFGKVAETNIPAYYDMDALTTHAVVAGATGGGKSISAQVIIEEALIKNIAVVVFDPTAQWSGMLRKCDDKKMLSFYPRFGLKPSSARAFPGSIKQIQNERQAIDVMKYMSPGQIQIFALNKLTPPQIDTFVASIIASIFKSDPKEHPELRMILIFDEVHRLLPKFGGSGKGFLQIERACREFRKWGFGVMLVSQVLSDFVGEIKANINTEVQMRTRDEADLNRLKTKYGEEFLQSLIKASVGVAMFVNPKYNRGKPYFINFRPILHNTRRLSDKVLEQYSQYTEKIEDLDYQIEQLEEEKVDVFDLKMELKLVKDKLMTGNFTVVDIYLEGLTPRIEKQWASLGKRPKKRELELIAEEDVEDSLKQAEKGREEFKKEESKPTKPKEPEDKSKSSREEEKQEEVKVGKEDGKTKEDSK